MKTEGVKYTFQIQTTMQNTTLGGLNVVLSAGIFNSTCARIYRPSFRENKPKKLIFNDLKLSFRACFRENLVYKFGHRSLTSRSKITFIFLPNLTTTKTIFVYFSPSPCFLCNLGTVPLFRIQCVQYCTVSAFSSNMLGKGSESNGTYRKHKSSQWRKCSEIYLVVFQTNNEFT